MNLSTIGSATGITAGAYDRIAPTHTAAQSDAPPPTGGPGRFASAIESAFASIGISLDDGGATTSTTAGATPGTAASATSTTTDDTSDAVGAFLQSLFAALHAQSSGATQPAAKPDDAAGTGSDASDAGASARAVGRAHHGHGGKLAADLNSLIQALGTQSGGASSSDASSTTVSSTTSSASTDSTLATLEQDFDALTAAKGGSTTGGTDALATFLQSLAASLHGTPATGNVGTAAA